MGSYEVQMFVNKPEKQAIQVCIRHVIMATPSNVHVQANVVLNISTIAMAGISNLF